MNKSELIQYLYNEINRQNTIYMWVIGLVIAFFCLYQLVYTSIQLKRNRKRAQDQLIKQFELQKLEDDRKKIAKIDSLEKRIKELTILVKRSEMNLYAYTAKELMKAENRIYNLISSLNKPDLDTATVENISNEINSEISELINFEHDRSKKLKIIENIEAVINEQLNGRDLGGKINLLKIKVMINALKKLLSEEDDN